MQREWIKKINEIKSRATRCEINKNYIRFILKPTNNVCSLDIKIWAIGGFLKVYTALKFFV